MFHRPPRPGSFPPKSMQVVHHTGVGLSFPEHGTVVMGVHMWLLVHWFFQFLHTLQVKVMLWGLRTDRAPDIIQIHTYTIPTHVCTQAPDLSSGVPRWWSCHALGFHSIPRTKILLCKGQFFHYRTVMFCQTSLSKTPDMQLNCFHGWVFVGLYSTHSETNITEKTALFL